MHCRVLASINNRPRYREFLMRLYASEIPSSEGGLEDKSEDNLKVKHFTNIIWRRLYDWPPRQSIR
jgi:hypothetical protein